MATSLPRHVHNDSEKSTSLQRSMIGTHLLEQKIEYIHDPPVRAEIVDELHHYKYSSAIDYADGIGLLKMEKVNFCYI